jgi:hypothetical protein
MVNLPERAFPGANSPVHSKRDEDVPAHAKAYRKAGLGAGPEPLLFVRKDDGFSHAEPPRLAHLTGFGPQVALAACLFGFAWAASSYFSGDQWPFYSAASESAAQQERKERAELARAVKKITGDMRGLEAGMDALRAGQAQAAKTRADLERLTARIDADKSETRAAIAAAAAEAERARREQEAALPQMTGRLDRLERKFAAQEAMPAAAAATPEVKEKTAPASADPARLESENSAGARKPHLITNWVVRDVYGGVALLESTRGTIEVALGEVVPGAGRVKAIERRGSGWIVITSRGLVDSASDVFMP